MTVPSETEGCKANWREPKLAQQANAAGVTREFDCQRSKGSNGIIVTAWQIIASTAQELSQNELPLLVWPNAAGPSRLKFVVGRGWRKWCALVPSVNLSGWVARPKRSEGRGLLRASKTHFELCVA